MSEAEPGRHYVVSGIYERDRQMLEFLDARGLRPGVKVDLVERNYDQTLSIRTAAGSAVLGRLPAEKIWLFHAR
jgi:hypothetical protein